MNLRVFFPKICNLTPPPPPPLTITHKRVWRASSEMIQSTLSCSNVRKMEKNQITFGILLIDLAKAFDNRLFKNYCLSHEFLVVKLTACGFSHTSLKLI